MKIILVSFVLVFLSCTSLNKKYPNFGVDQLTTDTAIRDVLFSNVPNFQKCVGEQNFKKKDSFVVVLTFKITPEGTTKDAHANYEINDNTSGCMKKVVLQDLKFPRNAKGGLISVTQPLNFYAKNN
ncbi:hypothetical protein N9N67_10405 [Bacteriovoracaceae bacterium]|nr:hypothetical protein [Bacteriovoracaceae bacterium]